MLKNKHTIKNLDEYLKESPLVVDKIVDITDDSRENKLNEMENAVSDFQNQLEK
jgi:hypothetical protein